MQDPSDTTALARTRPPRRRVLAAVVSVLAVGAIAAVAVTADDGSHAPSMSTTSPATPPLGPALKASPVVAAVPVSDTELAALPAVSTFAALPQAPPDPAPQQTPPGLVVHPQRVIPVFAVPGGPPIAALPPTQLVSDTWLPVVTERPGWVQVLLPGRPNGATGWLVNDEHIAVATTPYRIVVDRANFRLTLLRDEHPVGSWRVGVGKANSPTPPGRTFLLASYLESSPTYSPVIIPLGAHSTAYTSYGGGPGTVGIHTWPNATVYGTASSDGCVRVPPDALQIVSSEVPLGTPVLIQ